MEGNQQQIYWGTLSKNVSGNFLFSPPEGVVEPGRFPVMVDAFSTNLAVEEFVIEIQNQLPQQVSILGQRAVDAPEVGGGEAIIADSVALHNDIAVRAYEIYRSGRAGSEFDNWISAERQLLGL